MNWYIFKFFAKMLLMEYFLSNHHDFNFYCISSHNQRETNLNFFPYQQRNQFVDACYRLGGVNVFPEDARKSSFIICREGILQLIRENNVKKNKDSQLIPVIRSYDDLEINL